MAKHYIARKSPALAGILSIIPGMGQIYNEQTTKGLILFIAFAGSFFYFVLMPVALPMGWQGFGWGGTDLGVTARQLFPGWQLSDKDLTKIYPLFWLIILFPIFMLYSITDAVQNARRINPGFTPPPSPQPRASQTSSPQPVSSPAPPAAPVPVVNTEQETLRKEAREKMEGLATPAPAAHSSTEDTTMNQAPTPPAPPNAKAPSPQGISGKFLLGIILMAVGGLYILEQWDFDILNWDRLWPLIPLVFGLRLLRDYAKDRDRGQFVLGTVFSAVGAVFLVNNWTNIEVVRFIHHYWMFVMFGVGVLFVLQDLVERRREG